MRVLSVSILIVIGVSVFSFSQESTNDWRTLVREYADARNWSAALGIVETKLRARPEDTEVLAWHARLLFWAGRLDESEAVWNKILAVAPDDPDHWMGIASVYSRREDFHRTLGALDRALQLDSSRADLHLARARALLTLGDPTQARAEFTKAAKLDPSNLDARRGLEWLRQVSKHRLLVGTETDLFNFSGEYQHNEITLSSEWSRRWKTSFASGFYERGGVSATKFLASATGSSRSLGALTLGTAVGHDLGIIPRHEALFGYGRSWKLPGSPFVRAIELGYGQHWYWYSTARVMAITQTTVLYLPRDWMWSLVLTGARTQLSGTASEWTPLGSSRLSFPLAGSEIHRLQGSVLFACGTENFSQLDQIGRSSSRSYGGSLRQQLTRVQDIAGFAAYQIRSQHQSQTSFGVTYGLRF